MKHIIISILLLVLSISCWSQNGPKRGEFTLDDFYHYDPDLERKVDEVFAQLNDTLIVGQMIVPAVGKHGKETSHVVSLAEKGMLGGVLLLNGNVESFTNFVHQFDSIAQVRGFLRPIYSADAEPTLIRYKIKETTPVPKTNEIKTTEEVTEVAKTISGDLNKIGITQNFAPVIDASPNQTVSNRSFGLNMDTVINFSNLFISETQNNQIIATAKHFPGHGFVTGDTHKQLVYIDGEMKEVRNYVPVIENGVLSIMVAHIAVKNNEEYDTDGLPSTCSRKIVTDLLKGELGFKGLVITDAMNMGGVVAVPNSGLKAIMAGCDQLLMPVQEMKDVYDILNEMASNEDFKQQVYTSVKKIIRLKICLGIVD
ncbi:MAG: glycoside hydrolase family 3 protein [Flavobacteriales bacterium]|nr:glycoside hydrolase family 3 protein [Flavobacteriales bacterium]